jgi:site-specific DNA recombinase
LIDKQEFEPRVTHIRARLQHLEAQMQHLQTEGEMEEELRLILGRLETFAAQVHNGLQQADFHTRREIIRSLVKRVEVDQQHLRVVFRVNPTSVLPSSDNASSNWQDSGRRVLEARVSRACWYGRGVHWQRP